MRRVAQRLVVKQWSASAMASTVAVRSVFTTTTGLWQQSSHHPPEAQEPLGLGKAAHQHSHPAEAESFEPPKKPTEAPKLLRVQVEHPKGISLLQLARPPVNSLSLEVLEELNKWLLWLGSNEETKALVLSSAVPTVFSAGIDLVELHRLKPERFTKYWQAMQETWLILNSFPKPIMGAITGNSPAAGCILALGCDYRVMARGPNNNPDHKRLYRIGLNETKLGLTAPAWTIPAYAYVVGSRTAERLLQLGETPTADEALKIGLVDEVTEDETKCLESAFRQAERFLAIPQQSRWISRDMMRREYLQVLATEEDRQYDLDFVMQTTSSPEVQKTLDKYIEALKSRSRK